MHFHFPTFLPATFKLFLFVFSVFSSTPAWLPASQPLFLRDASRPKLICCLALLAFFRALLSRLTLLVIFVLYPAVHSQSALYPDRVIFFLTQLFASIAEFRCHAPIAFSFLALVLLQSLFWFFCRDPQAWPVASPRCLPHDYRCTGCGVVCFTSCS